MKNNCKNLTFLLVLIILLSALCGPVRASTIEVESESGFPVISVEEIAIKETIERYFSQRELILTEQDGTLSDISNWYQVDLLKHLAAMKQADITRISSTLQITNIHISNSETHAYVIEHLIYVSDNITYSEDIYHDILLLGSGTTWRIVDDSYFEEASNFASCSFIHESFPYEPAATNDGSASCIVAIANNEIGYTEGSSNYTKYGTWYGRQTAWCVIFVEWCADKADVPSSIIPYDECVVSDLKDFFTARNQFYYKSDYTPKPGDIAFYQGTVAEVGHVGIVVQVSSGTIYCVEGNTTSPTDASEPEGVYRKRRNLSADYVVGFGVPSYNAVTHTSLSAWSVSITHHWRSCENCSTIVVNKEHTFVDNSNTNVSTCSVCGYTKST